jgi:hypothetical protein
MASAFASSSEFSQTYGALNNQQFVEQLYHNVLGRDGEASGIAAWTNALNGGASRGQVLAGFSESNEHIQLTAPAIAAGIWDVNETAASIARLCDSAFNRLPDANGLLGWKSAVNNGTTLATVADGFVGSAEFQSTYGSLTNQQFVELLYHNVLDRTGEPAGVSAWTHMLDGGVYDRGDVLLGFSESFEHQMKTDRYRYLPRFNPDIPAPEGAGGLDLPNAPSPHRPAMPRRFTDRITDVAPHAPPRGAGIFRLLSSCAMSRNGISHIVSRIGLRTASRAIVASVTILPRVGLPSCTPRSLAAARASLVR